MRFVKPLLAALAAVAVIGVVLHFVQKYSEDEEEVTAPVPEIPLPADGQLHLQVDAPAIEGRRARVSATYSRRTEAHQMRGGSHTGAGESSVFYRLEAMQTIAAVDPQGRPSAYCYEVGVLRVGQTNANSAAVLTGGEVRVLPRADGQAVVMLDGTRVQAGGNGVYEAFAKMTPVVLGRDGNARYNVNESRRVGTPSLSTRPS